MRSLADWANLFLIVRNIRETIEDMFGEKRLLLNMACKYIRADFANRLLDHVRNVGSPSQQTADAAMQRVVGKEELGDPASITISGV